MTRPYIADLPSRPALRRQFDVLVLGGGIAGLTAAIAAARRWHVGLLTKASLNDTTTFLAQGGIAAALGESDSPDLHFQDTVEAGAGLCDPGAVRVLVDEGPDRVRELMEICPRFDRHNGEIVLGREGAHSVRRVVHAGGDATGREVSSALSEAARLGSRVQLYEDEFVIDLLDFDRDQKGLATTRSQFRALHALAADAGVELPKIGYTPELLAATGLDIANIGELRWDRIEDRLMGLVPHEFRALVMAS